MAPKAKATTKKEETKVIKKTAPPKAEEPEAKRAKVEPDDTSAKKDAEEEPKEEIDAPTDSRPAFKGTVGFEAVSTTLNVVVASNGRTLSAVTDGGIQYLIAGARANVGVKAGRYMYEVRMVEMISPFEAGAHAKVPKQVVRIGVSTEGSSLILGDGGEGVYFDSEGIFFVDSKRTYAGKKFTPNCVAALLLNLDPKSPFANTVSLFLDGERASKPQPLPEALKGKPLFPHVSYRNVTMQVHFGPEPFRALPFKCRTVQGAAAADVVKAKLQVPADGKYDVVFPVGFPGEGTFDWLDEFLEKNPQYVELSDRKIIEWATKSGLQKKATPASKDKPGFNFGVPMMDDLSASRIVKTLAPLVPRHYVVMEVKENLLEASRAQNVKRFPSRHFKKIAQVVMGEPPKEYVGRMKNKVLADRQAKIDSAHKASIKEKEKRKAQERRAKEIAVKRKAKDEERKKAAVAAVKMKVEAARKRSTENGDEAMTGAGTDTAQPEDKDEQASKEEARKEEQAKAETKEEEMKKEEDVKEEEEQKPDMEDEEEAEEDAPKAALTEEEEKLLFLKSDVKDLSPAVLDQCYGHFSIPSKTEGFDQVRYEWQDETKSKDYLRALISEKKRASRLDKLQPSDWFKAEEAEWTRQVEAWQAKQRAAKSKPKGKKTEEEEAVFLDIDAVDDVCDIGDGEPLFLNFAAEDWALLNIRRELHLLVVAFRKDTNDPDRAAIPEEHVAFYYGRYFRKALTPKTFGKESIKDLVAMLADTVAMSAEPALLSAVLPEDAPSERFVKLVEESRRARQRRIDAGDETARLPFKITEKASGPAGASAKGKAKAR